MKVAIDATAVTQRPSGARTRMLNLYTRLNRDQGLDITTFIAAQSGLADAFQEAGHNVIELSSRAPVALRGSDCWNPVARRVHRLGGFDLFVAETLPMPAARGMSLCVTLHDLRFRNPNFSALFRRLYARLMLASNLKRADAIITVSTAMKKEIQAAWPRLPSEKVHVVHNGIPPIASLDPEEARKIRQRLNVKAPYMLCISHLEPRKNLDNLVHAFVKMKKEFLPDSDYQLVLGGAPQPGFSKAMLPFPGGKAGFDHEQWIWLLEPLGEEERAALLAGASLVVQPSLYEGFGLGVLEAMHLEIPVACSSIPAHEEVAGGGAFYFSPQSIEEMASVMAEAVENEAERSAKRREGLKSSARFSWDRSAERILDIWIDLHSGLQ